MTKHQSKLAAWYDSVAAFDVAALFSRPRKPGIPRTIFINENPPDDYFDSKKKVKKEHVYDSNQVVTSKYTVITFLPRNLLEQFRRVANVFFLAIAILQFFSKFSTISPGLVIFPLLVVLGITAAKDGYEDVKRHQSDRSINRSTVRVLSGGDWENRNVTSAKARRFSSILTLGRFRRRNKALPKGPGGSSPDPEQGLGQNGAEDISEDGGGAPLKANHGRAHWRQTAWEDLKVGDFVKIVDHQSLPADILICATSEDENVAFIETKNLDGETNLKSRHAVPELTHIRSAADCADQSNGFKISCEKPDTNMYRLNGAIETAEQQRYPIDIQMTLLRGTVLRNTRWVIGIVLFTGHDTKVILNSGGTPSKRSKVERQMNPQVFLNLLLLATMAVVCGIVDSAIEVRKYPEQAPWLYGDNLKDDNPHINGLVTWAFALITFQNIVPISLYISIEFVRTCQAAFIYFDSEMVYEKTERGTLARSYNLSDDLGQIEYIFSDKTGTLTQNMMIFRQCSIGGKVYKGDPVENGQIVEKPRVNRISSNESTTVNGSADSSPRADTVLPHFNDSSLKRDIEAAGKSGETDGAHHARSLNGFFTVLGLCHTVIASTDLTSGELVYKAQSPDEAALVQAAADVGFIFRGRDREVLSLQTPFSQEIERYELLNVLEFTSARKRMSVVLRRLDGEDRRIFLLSKGADNVIFERLKPGADELKDMTGRQLDEFAGEGLRTLTLAYKVISEEEYAAWADRYHAATILLDGREEKINSVSDELEHDLRLLGATAIEDRLQDGVPETIADLKRAGIKIWVATGDKLETAIAIGYSTNLIGRESNIIVIRGGGEEGKPVWQQLTRAVESFFPESGIIENGHVVGGPPGPDSVEGGPGTLRRAETGISSIVGENNGDRPGGFVLVIDGGALGEGLADDAHRNLLLRLATLCEGVICCRVSPLQKALVVELVREGLGAMTLAIGDGANDVSMIQAAHVGVGISGEEGLQAVNASDYAIGQFRFLKRLLLVHGHWSYARNGNMILNFFYKNIVCIGVLWWFQLYDGWSSSYVFEYTYLLWWNAFWTLAPVVGIGLFDRIIDAKTLMAIPELYRYGREGRWFSLKLFCIFMLDGVFQSAVIYFIITYAYFVPTARKDGYQVGQYEYSTVMVIAAVITVNLFAGLTTDAWTAWVFFTTFIGIVLVWVYTAFYSAISPGWFSTPVYGNDHFLFLSAYFWLCLPVVVAICLAPRYIAKAWQFGYNPNDIDILRYVRKKQPGRDVIREAYTGGGLSAFRRPASIASHASRVGSMINPSLENVRPSLDPRQASRTDMSTGIRSIHRGFDFTTEEGGVAMRRIQTNLSERRESNRQLATVSGRKRGNTLSQALHRGKNLLSRSKGTLKDEREPSPLR